MNLNQPFEVRGATDHLVVEAARAAAEQAKAGKVEVTINNVPGRPFELINLGGGKVAWGVGGSGGAALESDRLMMAAARAAVEQARNGEVQVTIQNVPGQPFQVVDLGGGKAAWGIGGSGGAAVERPRA